jgi:hypothetical protein
MDTREFGEVVAADLVCLDESPGLRRRSVHETPTRQDDSLRIASAITRVQVQPGEREREVRQRQIANLMRGGRSGFSLWCGCRSVT